MSRRLPLPASGRASRLGGVAVLVALLTACPAPPASLGRGPAAPKGAPKASAAPPLTPKAAATTPPAEPKVVDPTAATRAHGRVLLPAKLLGDHGGSLITDNGAGLITDNGAGLITDNGGGVIANNAAGLGATGGGTGGAKPYAVLVAPAVPRRLVDTATAAGVAVVLLDERGRPLAGVTPTTTDAEGRFAFRPPPVDANVIVAASFTTADGKRGAMRAHARLERGNGEFELTLASTFVAVAVAGGEPGTAFDLAALARAAAATDAQLTPADAERLLDLQAIKARMDELARGVEEVRTALMALDARFAALEKRVDDLSQKVNALLSPSPSPTPTPLPSAPATQVTTIMKGTLRKLADGMPDVAGIGAIVDVAVGADGEAYVTDFPNAAVRRIRLDGHLLTCAGGKGGRADGVGPAAAFNTPLGIARDAAGALLIADWNNAAIRKVVVDAAGVGTVTTVAGGTLGFADGVGAAASFRQPHDVAVLPDGAIAVVDQGNNAVRRIAPDGTVTTWAGGGSVGDRDGVGAKALFNAPIGAAAAPDGSLYVNDRGNHRIRKVAPDGTVTTIAGSGKKGDADGYGVEASFANPEGLAVDAQGRLLIADTENNKIKRYDPATRAVITLAGAGGGDHRDGDGAAALFAKPTGIAVAADGSIYVVEGNARLRRIAFPQP